MATAQAASGRAADPARRCAAGYSYSGLFSDSPFYGLSATITPSAAAISSGHVAAYVNAGTPARWLQIGINTTETTSSQSQHLYSELRLPGESPVYHELGEVASGQSVRVALAAVHSRPGYWQLYVAGQPKGAPVYLSTSRKGLLVSASAENWHAGQAACNTFAYEFAAVRTLAKPGGSWRPTRSLYAVYDPGTDFTWRSQKTLSFTASGMHGSSAANPT